MNDATMPRGSGAWRGGLLYREHISGRVILALLLMAGGGATLAFENVPAGRPHLVGLLLVAFATLAWALDNVMSRPLSILDPGRVVLGKAALGGLATATLAIVSHQSAPPVGPAAALLAVGAGGYGLSLRLYLLAQREFGAARTGSVFAFAPFLGAVLSLVIANELLRPPLIAGALLMLAGLILHLTESHRSLTGRDQEPGPNP